MPLNDELYSRLVNLYQNLDDDQTHNLNARLILLLSEKISDLLELKKIIVCVLFVNGANKYFQTKSFCNEPTLEEHHLAREKLVIADTDISVMIGFIKRLNLDEEYLSSHDKEMLALGYESKYIENGDDMRLKDRVSFIPLDL